MDIRVEIEMFSKQFGVDITDIVVGCGAAMVLHGLIPKTDDIDIDIKDIIKYRLALKDLPKDAEYSAWNWGTIAAHFEKPDNDYVYINGLKVWSIEKLLGFYKYISVQVTRSRNKRSADLEKIRRLEELSQ